MALTALTKILNKVQNVKDFFHLENFMANCYLQHESKILANKTLEANNACCNFAESTQRLPLNNQTELAATLLREANGSRMKPKIRDTCKPPLEILSGISVVELQTLADAVLAPGRQRRLHNLLRKNQMRELSAKEEKAETSRPYCRSTK